MEWPLNNSVNIDLKSIIKALKQFYKSLFYCYCRCFMAHMVNAFWQRLPILPKLNSIIYSKLLLSMNSHLILPLRILCASLAALPIAFLFRGSLYNEAKFICLFLKTILWELLNWQWIQVGKTAHTDLNVKV